MDPATTARSIFVVSDLHIGGAYDPEKPDERGFRMCTRARALADFVESLPKLAAYETIELIINGDFIDFLAETRDQKFWSYHGAEAVSLLDTILDPLRRPQEAFFFAALRAHVLAGRHLTILIGNHDVELALPAVQQRLADALGGPRPNLRFLEAHNYTIGDIYIEHGNRFDPWNYVDPTHIRSLCDGSLTQFRPPAGSELVRQVITPLKRAYPFIDLLKPEIGAAIPVLLALAPSSRGNLLRIVRLWSAQLASRTNVHEAVTRASGSAGPPATESGNELDRLVAEVLGGDAERRAFEAAVRDVQNGNQIVQAAGLGETLGWLALLLGAPNRLKALHQALGALHRDLSLLPNIETDEQIVRAAEARADGLRWIILGHTHLAKSVQLSPTRTYLNSGTWTDLIPFPTWLLDGEAGRARLQDFLESLQDPGRIDGLVDFRPNYIHIEFDGTRAERCTLEPSAER